MRKKIWYKKGYSLNGQFVNANDGKLFPRRMKPFDCAQCLSFWIALGVTYLRYDRSIIESLVTACICCILTTGISKLIK